MKSFFKGLGILFLVMCFVALFIPIGHGAMLGQLLWGALKKEITEYPKKVVAINQQRVDTERRQEQFYQSLSSRFAGALAFQPEVTTATWQYGHVEGVNAWLHMRSGMIWREYQGFSVYSWSQEQLIVAKQYCQDLSPQGYWNVPTNAEFALAVNGRMQTVISDIKGRWMSQTYSHSLVIPDGLATVVGFQNQGVTKTSVRCVGRTEKVPEYGYIRDDISNADVLGLLTH